MPIILRAKIVKVQVRPEGPLFESLFLLEGSDLASPMWTKEMKSAGIWPWEKAEEMARKLNCHAVVISNQGETAESRAKEQPGRSREDRIASYQRTLAARKLD